MSQPGDGDPPKTNRDSLGAWWQGCLRVIRRVAGGLNGNPSPDDGGGARPFFSNEGGQAAGETGRTGKVENESEIPGGRFTLTLLVIGLVLLFAKNLTDNDHPDLKDLYVTRQSQSYAGPDANSQKLEPIPRGRHVPPGEKRVDGWRRLSQERAYIRAANLSPFRRPAVRPSKPGTYLDVGETCAVSEEADVSVPTVLLPGRYRVYGTVTGDGPGKGKLEVLLPGEGVVYAVGGACVPPARPPPDPPPEETPPVIEESAPSPAPEPTPHGDDRVPDPDPPDEAPVEARPPYVAELEESGLKTLQPRHILRGPSSGDYTLSETQFPQAGLVVARCRIEFSWLRGWTVRQCNVLGSDEHRERYKAKVRRLSIKFALNGRELGRSGIRDFDNILVPFPFRNPHPRRPSAEVPTREERPDVSRDAGVD